MEYETRQHTDFIFEGDLDLDLELLAYLISDTE